MKSKDMSRWGYLIRLVLGRFSREYSWIVDEIEIYPHEFNAKMDSVELTEELWVDQVRDFLNASKAALSEGDINKALHYLHQAQQLEIVNLSKENRELLERYALLLLFKIQEEYRFTSIRRSIEDLLLEQVRPGPRRLHSGVLNSELGPDTLRLAYELFHDFEESGLQMQLYLGKLMRRWLVLGSAIVGLLLFHLWLYSEAAIPSQPDAPVNTFPFLSSVVLFGAIGGWLLGAVALIDNSRSRIERNFLREGRGVGKVLILLPLTAVVSALAVYSFITSGLIVTQVVTPKLILAFAVIAGFSVNWVVRIIHSITRQEGSERDSRLEIRSGREESER